MKKTNLKHTNIYRLFLTPIFVILLTISGCVKQSDCDCGVKGKFIYKPYWSSKYNTTIKAHFIPESNYYSYYKIEGFIPKEYKISDTLYVSICTTVRENTPNLDDVDPIFKLKCIEIAK